MPLHWSWPHDDARETRMRSHAIGCAIDAPPALARALAHRGFDEHDARALSPTPAALNATTASLGPPPNLDATAEAILAQARRGPVGIIADYDVDGGTSQAILTRALNAAVPEAKTLLTVPDRLNEGFGPNARCVRSLAEQGAVCSVSLDCGTHAAPVLDSAHREGMNTIIIDHHPSWGAASPAGTLLNPWADWNGGDTPPRHGELCTAALTWHLALKILRKAGLDAEQTAHLRADLTVLAALGSTCDVMPVGREQLFNRALIRAGVHHARRHGGAGFAALTELGVRPDNPMCTSDFGFAIGPRLNAGSRMGESQLAAECLRETDPERAAQLAQRLDIHNQARREHHKRIEKSLLARATAEDFAKGPVIVAVCPEATPGTVGLAAAALRKQFGWPAAVLTSRNDEPIGPDTMLHGSARSALNYDFGAAVAGGVQHDVIAHGGGHAAACGLTIKASRLEDVRRFLTNRFYATCHTNATPMIRIDAELTPSNTTTEELLTLAQCETALEPFGKGFARPVYGLRKVHLLQTHVTRDGAHVRLMLAHQKNIIEAIWFNAPEDWPSALNLDDNPERRAPSYQAQPAPRDCEIDLAGHVSINRWRGRESPQLLVNTARPSPTGTDRR